jgi:uncharacterized protein (TIGR02145 family)
MPQKITVFAKIKTYRIDIQHIFAPAKKRIFLFILFEKLKCIRCCNKKYSQKIKSFMKKKLSFFMENATNSLFDVRASKAKCCLAMLCLALLGLKVTAQPTVTPGAVGKGETGSYSWVVWLTPESGYTRNSNTDAVWTNIFANNPNTGVATGVGNFVSPNNSNHKGSGTGIAPTWSPNPGYNFHRSLNFTRSGNNSESRLLAQNDYNMGNKNLVFICVYKRETHTNSTWWNLFLFNVDNNGNIAWYNGVNNGELTWLHGNEGAGTSGSYLLDANEGMITIDRPNTGAAANSSDGRPVHAYVNGANNGINRLRGHLNATNTLAVATNGGTGYGYNGKIQEIIVLSAGEHVTGKDIYMHPADLQRIHTYLAVKYGFSMSKNTQDWFIADVTVWDRSAEETYNNNIFGIGRYDATGLYQKQSRSQDDVNGFIAFVGDLYMKDFNKDNSGVIPDGHFLMFGSNNMSFTDAKDWNYNHIQFVNSTLPSPLKFRHAPVLRAQTTGVEQFTVNINTGATRAHFVLVSSDPTFPNSNTRIYKVDAFANSAANVVVNDGDYIGFANTTVAPGGISKDLKMWMRADALIDQPYQVDAANDISNTKVIQWRDFMGETDFRYWKMTSGHYPNASTPTAGSNPAPAFQNRNDNMNFYPGLKFEKLSNEYQTLSTDNSPFSSGNPDHTIISVVCIDKYATTQNSSFLLSFGSTHLSSFSNWENPNSNSDNYRRPAYGFVEGKGQGACQNIHSVTSDEVMYNIGSNTIASHIYNNEKRNLTFESNGYSSTTPQGSAPFNGNLAMEKYGLIGGGSVAGFSFDGKVNEVVGFERVLTQTEKNRVYSYLGLKYGITLRAGTKPGEGYFNYELSDGTVVWSASTNSFYQRFHNNVTAIVRDDQSRLNNMQARSSDTAAMVLMGIGNKIKAGEIANENYSEYCKNLSGLDNDLEAIVWGHNGGSRAAIDYDVSFGEEPCGIFNKIIEGRIWMVEAKTNKAYNVSIGAYGKDAFPFHGANWRVTLLLADSEQKLIDQNWDAAIPGIFLDGMHRFTLRFEPNTPCFFTFAAEEIPIPCEVCMLEDLLKPIKFTTKNWPHLPNRYLERNFILNDNGFKANIRVNVPAGTILTSYTPRAFYDALYLRRYKTPENTVKIDITLDAAAYTTFDIRKIDYYWNNFTSVKVYGTCQNEEIIPRLAHVAPEKSSVYTINKKGGRATANKKRMLGSLDKRAWMLVDFGEPVKTIHIEFDIVGKNRAIKDLHIGPLSFACPAPPPPVNMDGLAMTLQAMPQEPLLCNEVTYTVRIQNANCKKQTANVKLPLQEGMVWVNNSAGLELENMDETTKVAGYGTNILTIDNIILQGSDFTVFTATARFKMEAFAGVYSSQAEITYTRENGTKGSVESCDRLSLGCVPTEIEALPSPTRMDMLQIMSFELDKHCFVGGDTLEVTLKINNPNARPIENAMLSFMYNESFIYEENSLSSPTIPNIGEPLFEEDEENLGNYFSGIFQLVGNGTTGFTIPPDFHTISFKIIAPENLDQYVDEEGEPMVNALGDPSYMPLDLLFEFSSLDELDECSASIFYEAYGDIMTEVLPLGYPAALDVGSNDNQTVCVDMPIDDIYYVNIDATGAYFDGLPLGVTGKWDANYITISGMPEESGVFDYTITFEGECGNVTKTGTITAVPHNTITLISEEFISGSPCKFVMTYKVTNATKIELEYDLLKLEITEDWAEDIYTLTIIPLEEGEHEFTIHLTGDCGIVSSTGTVDFISGSIELISSAVSEAQSICHNVEMDTIVYHIVGVTGMGDGLEEIKIVGLPDNLTYSVANENVKIFGTPIVDGEHLYEIIFTDVCGKIIITGTIIVYPEFNEGKIATTGQFVCPGETSLAQIGNVKSASGGDGLIHYRWLKNGIPIPGAHGETYTPPATDAITGGDTITYTRQANDIICSGWITSEGEWKLIVYPEFSAGAITGTGETLCVGSTPSKIEATPAAGGYGEITYIWHKNVGTEVPITVASGTDKVTYTPPATDAATSGTIIYSRHVKDEMCHTNAVKSTGSWTLKIEAKATINTAVIKTTEVSICDNNTSYTLPNWSGAITNGYGEWSIKSTSYKGNLATGNVYKTNGVETVVFTYSVYSSAAGACSSSAAVASADLTLQVIHSETITLATPKTANQTIYVNALLEPIVYEITGATEVHVIGLPAGVTGTFANNQFTISGISNDKVGVYNYIVTITGECGTTTVTGVIELIPACPKSVYDAANDIWYSVIYLVGHCWTQENIYATKYQDDTDIPFAKPYYHHSIYPDSALTKTIFGLLYDYGSAFPDRTRADERSVCPEGWRIPTTEEWTTLNGCNMNGLRNPLYWLQPNKNTNSLLFDLRAAGFYNSISQRYEQLYGYTAFWSSDAISPDATTVMGVTISYYCSQVEIMEFKKDDGLSVRCIME